MTTNREDDNSTQHQLHEQMVHALVKANGMDVYQAQAVVERYEGAVMFALQQELSSVLRQNPYRFGRARRGWREGVERVQDLVVLKELRMLASASHLRRRSRSEQFPRT